MANVTKSIKAHLSGTPVAALVVDEDGFALPETVAHIQSMDVTAICVLTRQRTPLDLGMVPVVQLPEVSLDDALTHIVQILSDQWLHVCFNGEFLAYPFAETRTLADFCGFLNEERRRFAHVTVVDHYPADLARAADDFSLEETYFDGTGYYADYRTLASDPKEPIAEIYGGLRWRYDEHFPEDRRMLNRAALFRCAPDLEFTPQMRFTDPRMNTLQCPWHRTPTAALRSFRAAKSLIKNLDRKQHPKALLWPQSVACDWSATQLMELGFMEPGQWF